jgi:hypothetical protein
MHVCAALTTAALVLVVVGFEGASAGRVQDGWAFPAHALAAPAAAAGGGGGWSFLSQTGCPHASASAHVLSDPPRLLVAGGASREGRVTQCTEELASPLAAGAGKWSKGAPLLFPRAAHAGAVINGSAYVFGGHLAKDPEAPPGQAPLPTALAEVLGPGGGSSWQPAPSLPSPRTGVRAATLPDGRALIVGGFEGAPPHWSYLNITLIFDGKSYTPGPELPCPAGPSPTCGLSNIGVQECGGSIFAVGGSGLEPAFAAVWRLDAAKLQAWVPAPALPSPLTWAATACVPAEDAGGGSARGAGATLYAIGGCG